MLPDFNKFMDAIFVAFDMQMVELKSDLLFISTKTLV
jgi:hypothetical protein